MARGPSGKFVIELDSQIKQDLYAALAADGLNLKEWFRSQVETYLKERSQPVLPGFDQTSHHSPEKLNPSLP